MKRRARLSIGSVWGYDFRDNYQGSPMITICGRASSINVQKAVWTAAELGLEVDRVDADGTIGSIDTPDYRKRNPFALVPTLVEDGFVLGQSLAIVRYLARKYGPGTLLPEDPDAAARAGAWMEWGNAAMRHKMIASWPGPPDRLRRPEDKPRPGHPRVPPVARRGSPGQIRSIRTN